MNPTHLFPHGLEVMLEVTELAEDRGTLSSLLVCHATSVLELCRQRDFQFGQLRDLIFGLLQLDSNQQLEGYHMNTCNVIKLLH